MFIQLRDLVINTNLIESYGKSQLFMIGVDEPYNLKDGEYEQLNVILVNKILSLTPPNDPSGQKESDERQTKL
jgi:hypothetical protein